MDSPSPQLIDRIRPPLAAVYDVERQFAVGGMAVVFVARDIKHDRRVALKVLAPDLAATVGASRFVREIRFAARLTHPHILPVLDSGEADSLPFYVMPFIEGESLRDRLDRERVVSVDEAIRLTEEVADALAYAHAAGIVHRDIKPENILLLGGHALVTDFGIARAITAAKDDADVTGIGITVGTPAYMSPEQAAGEDQIDGRSDTYSLATVFYEMVVGTTPFHDRSALAMIAKRFTHVAPRMSSKVEDVPADVDNAVAHALAMRPNDRPALVAMFARALTGGRRPSPAQTLDARTTRPATPRSFAVSETHMPSVAVLPFANLSSDPENEFFSDGITEEIIGALSRRRTIRVAARTSSFAFKGKHDDIRNIAEQLGVSTILDGSVRRAGGRVRVRAQLTDARSGYELWSNQLDRELNDVFAIQDEIANSIASALQATLLGDAVQAPGVSVAGPVYEAYLRGRFALNKRTEAELTKAVNYFCDANERDPEFALAYAGLGDAMLVRGVYGAEPPRDVMPLARAAVERALAIDPSLPEAYTTLGAVRAVYDWDWSGSEDAFTRSIALGPRYPTAHQWYAVNCLVPQRRFDEAIRAIDRARVLDPLALVIRATGGVVRWLAGDFDAAVRELEQALELDPSFAMTHYFMGSVRRDRGETSAAVSEFETAIAKSGGGSPEMLAGLASTLALGGDTAGAVAIRDRLVSLGRQRHVAPSLVAQVEASLGNADVALTHLEQAVADRDADMIFLGVRQAYQPLHGHPRFEALRAKIALL
ncbi:MAG: protein kinase [Gemmatimonadaceae bacterium]